MIEPFYIRQSHKPGRTREDRMSWFKECAAEAVSEGAKLCRFSYHPDDPDLCLVEAWKESRVATQGPLRWQLTFPEAT